jgi:hypothetical protein
MKQKFLFLVLLLMGSLNVYAEKPNAVSETIYDDSIAMNAAGAANTVEMGEETSNDSHCSCRCTAQGILLRECGDETENLGNYANIQNCNLQKENHPKCN